jgi:hypothetical protein
MDDYKKLLQEKVDMIHPKFMELSLQINNMTAFAASQGLDIDWETGKVKEVKHG